MQRSGKKESDNSAFYTDINETSNSTVPGTQGLYNKLYTCYLISALQLLSQVVPLTSVLLEEKDDTEKKPVTSLYAKLLRAMWCYSKNELLKECVTNLAVKIRELTNSFEAARQHDCEELLCKLLDFMHDELKPARDENPEVEPRPEKGQGDTLEEYLQQAENSIVSDQFRIVTCQTVTCNTCQFRTSKYDRTNILQLTFQSTVPKDVFWVPLDVSVCVMPTLLRLDVPKPYTVKEMREVLLQKLRIPEKTPIMFISRVSGHFGGLKDESYLTDIPDRCDIYALKYPDNGAMSMCLMLHMCGDEHFGQDICYPIQTDQINEQNLTKQLLKYMERYVRVPEIDAALQGEEEPVTEESPKAVEPEQMDSSPKAVEPEQMDMAQEKAGDTKEDEDFDLPDTLAFMEDVSYDSNNSENSDTLVEEEDSEQKHGGDSPRHVEGLRSKTDSQSKDDRETTAPSEAPDVVVEMEKAKDEIEEKAQENTDENEKTAMDTGDVVLEFREQGADVGEKVKTKDERTDREKVNTLEPAKAAAELLQPGADTGEDKKNDPHGQNQGTQAGGHNVMDTTDTTAVAESSSPTQSTETRRRKKHSLFIIRGCKFYNSQKDQNDEVEYVDLSKADYLRLEWNEESRKLYDENEAEMFHQTRLVNTPFNSSAPLTLQSLLESFVDEEFLGGSNAYDCPSCKKKQPATRRTAFEMLPPYLIVHFKSRQTVGVKDDQLVDFPIRDLDLSRFLSNPEQERQNEPPIYDLVAVCNHDGGMEGGHYWTHAKNKLDGRWRMFDDRVVHLIKPGYVEKKLITNLAYVLLYERRTDNAKKAETLEGAIKVAPPLEEPQPQADDQPPPVSPSDQPVGSSLSSV